MLCSVTKTREIAAGLVAVRMTNERIARSTRAGQFVNVLPTLTGDPMLRRPFSVYGTFGSDFEIIVQVVGRGTSLIANAKAGSELDVIGPLGNPWKFDSADFETAILLIGGVGVASMPLLTKELLRMKIDIETYYGARTKNFIAKEGLEHLHLTTDDGSTGYHGTNIALLRSDLKTSAYARPKLFVCGPTGMMRAAKSLAEELDLNCELSLETEMACGIGICQGCPVLTDETTFAQTGKRFRLSCTEGPSFDAKSIQI